MLLCSNLSTTNEFNLIIYLLLRIYFVYLSIYYYNNGRQKRVRAMQMLGLKKPRSENVNLSWQFYHVDRLTKKLKGISFLFFLLLSGQKYSKESSAEWFPLFYMEQCIKLEISLKSPIFLSTMDPQELGWRSYIG